MHDPKTVAHEIKFPKFWTEDFWTKKGFRYYCYIQLGTIWHVDPERFGDDDSCDWVGWRHMRNRKILAGVRDVLADSAVMAQVQHLLDAPRYVPNQKYQSLTALEPPIAHTLALITAEWIWWRGYGKKLPTYLRDRMLMLATNPHDSLSSYTEADRYVWRVALCLQAYSRPWWRHPKWHVCHWQWYGVVFNHDALFPSLVKLPHAVPPRLGQDDPDKNEFVHKIPSYSFKFPIPVRGWSLQIHHWQAFKRIFEKCNGCGKSLGYGYSPFSSGGHRHLKTGKWIEHLYHRECCPGMRPAPKAPETDAHKDTSAQ